MTVFPAMVQAVTVSLPSRVNRAPPRPEPPPRRGTRRRAAAADSRAPAPPAPEGAGAVPAPATAAGGKVTGGRADAQGQGPLVEHGPPPPRRAAAETTGAPHGIAPRQRQVSQG